MIAYARHPENLFDGSETLKQALWAGIRREQGR
jgi:hypothetical protein